RHDLAGLDVDLPRAHVAADASAGRGRRSRWRGLRRTSAPGRSCRTPSARTAPSATAGHRAHHVEVATVGAELRDEGRTVDLDAEVELAVGEPVEGHAALLTEVRHEPALIGAERDALVAHPGVDGLLDAASRYVEDRHRA